MIFTFILNYYYLDLGWVKFQDLSERVIVGPSDLSRLRNLLLSPPYGAAVYNVIDKQNE